MKKNLKLMFGLLIGLFLFACKKDLKKQNENSISDYNRELRKMTGALGKMHNNGVGFALNAKSNLNNRAVQSLFPSAPDPSITTPQNYTIADLKQISTSIYDFVESLPEFAGVSNNRGIPADLRPSLISLINAPTASVIDASLDSTVLLLKSENLLSQREAGMIKELQDIFINGYALNMNETDAGIYFANQFNILKSQADNILWNIDEGALFLGALEIAISSNEYWHAIPPPTVEPEGYLVYVDAGAYIRSWAKQVIKEYSEGTLDESGQWRRIGTALQSAISASTFKYLRKNNPGGLEFNVEMFDDSSLPPATNENGTVSLVQTISPEDLLFNLDYETLKYCPTLSSITDGVADNEVPIFMYNQRFYTTNGFTTFVSDGFYRFDVDHHFYYQITNGRAVAIYQWTP